MRVSGGSAKSNNRKRGAIGSLLAARRLQRVECRCEASLLSRSLPPPLEEQFGAVDAVTSAELLHESVIAALLFCFGFDFLFFVSEGSIEAGDKALYTPDFGSSFLPARRQLASCCDGSIPAPVCDPLFVPGSEDRKEGRQSTQSHQGCAAKKCGNGSQIRFISSSSSFSRLVCSSARLSRLYSDFRR